MEITKENNCIKIKGSEFFDLEKTLECGQLFRYYKNGDYDYDIISKDLECHIIQKGDDIRIETENVDYFYNYFDLDTDYSDIHAKLCGFDELAKAALSSKGIRILKQDLFEVIISFIISANNNIPRIKGIIEKLSLNFGKMAKKRHAFVANSDLSKVTEQQFREAGAGFRAPYLEKTAKILQNDAFLIALNNADNETATRMLLSLKGVGQKVTDCVMLFGLYRTNSYPVDTWIFKANKTDELNTIDKVNKFYSNRYGYLAGYAQQYVFYSKRNLGM